MNQFLKNYRALFSQDNQEVYRALCDKKDWLFVPLFLKANFQKAEERYVDLFDLLDQVILMEDIHLSPDDLGSFEEDYFTIDETLKPYRYRRFYPYPEKTTEESFFIEYDFRSIDEKAYRELFPNLFPCITKEEVLSASVYDRKNAIDCFAFVMIGKPGQMVLILEQSVLLNNRYYAPYVKAIHVPSDLAVEKKQILLEIAAKLNIIIKEM